MKKSKMGRPRKPKADKWSRQITLRFRPGEFERLRDAARRAGKRLTTYLHDKLTGEE